MNENTSRLNSKSSKAPPSVSRKAQSVKRKPGTSQQTTQQANNSSAVEINSSINSPPSRRRTEPPPGLPQPRRSTRSRSLSPWKSAETGEHSDNSKKMTPQVQPPEPSSTAQVEEPDELDICEPPSQYQIGGLTTVHLHHSREFKYPEGTQRDALDIEYPVPPHAARETEINRAHQKTPVKEQGGGLGGIVAKMSSFVWHSSPRSSSPKEHPRTRIHEPESDAQNLRREHRGRRAAREQTSGPQLDYERLQQDFRNRLEGKELEWKERERKLRNDLGQTVHEQGKRANDLEGTMREMKSRLLQSESEKRQIQDNHNTFIRKQQEASFKQMESARWLPKEENKVMADLERLKTNMRSWAKQASIKDVSLLQSLGADDHASMVQVLAQVVVLENNQLPKVLLAAARAQVLLLNALLAHSVYTSVFQDPFFFVKRNQSDVPSNSFPGVSILDEIYHQAKQGNQEDAHLWRSQTLRLLMPPGSNEMSDGEQDTRNKTEFLIADAAHQQAMNFLAGPARHLIDTKAKTDFTAKLNKIFNEAASMAYMLWTRRTDMRVYSLHDMGETLFDAESPYFEPDTLVRHDDHDDGLRGRPITMVVHPLLKAYGTDEAKDYDEGRVWAKGVVWLDSRKV